MAQRAKYSFQKRHFLNSILTEHTSYISVLCESSHEGNNQAGLYMVTIADCRRVVELDSLHNAAAFYGLDLPLSVRYRGFPRAAPVFN